MPNTARSSPATDTCICSLPTSTNAARGSTIARCFMVLHFQVELLKIASRRRPGRVTRNANLSNEKQSSPKCAADRDQSQSSMRAVERDAQRTIGLVSHAAGVRHASFYGTRFTVRVWLCLKLQASIEWMSSGKWRLPAAAAHGNVRPHCASLKEHEWPQFLPPEEVALWGSVGLPHRRGILPRGFRRNEVARPKKTCKCFRLLTLPCTSGRSSAMRTTVLTRQPPRCPCLRATEVAQSRHALLGAG